MNKLYLSLMAMGCSLASLAGVRSDFAVDTISTQVGNFQLDSINLSSPLNYYLSRAWVRSTGKQRLWHDISTSKFNFDANAADEVVDSDMRSYIANETIDRIVVYRDSVAAIITHTEGGRFGISELLLDRAWAMGKRRSGYGGQSGTGARDASKAITLPLCESSAYRPD